MQDCLQWHGCTVISAVVLGKLLVNLGNGCDACPVSFCTTELLWEGKGSGSCDEEERSLSVLLYTTAVPGSSWPLCLFSVG